MAEGGTGDGPEVLWPVNDMGDDVSYLDHVSDEKVTTRAFWLRQVAEGRTKASPAEAAAAAAELATLKAGEGG